MLNDETLQIPKWVYIAKKLTEIHQNKPENPFQTVTPQKIENILSIYCLCFADILVNPCASPCARVFVKKSLV